MCRFSTVLCCIVAGTWGLAEVRLVHAADMRATSVPPTIDVIGPEIISPDLSLYREVIAGVRRGENYYTIAGRELPRWGFPVHSPFNWRLPTYAWLASLFPNNESIRWILIAAGATAVISLVGQIGQREGPFVAWLAGWGAWGVLQWLWDGDAYLAQEVWVAIGLFAALSARYAQRHGLATGLELGCLFLRELVLPWLGVGFVVAVVQRRYREASGIAFGVFVWCGFFAWHVGQVQGQLTGSEPVQAGLHAWCAWGGPAFVLHTIRMNRLVHAVPIAVVACAYVVSLWGLATWRTELGHRLLAIVVLYSLAFCVVGQTWHQYWGLLFAPILPLGFGRGVVELARRIRFEAWTLSDTSTKPAA